VAVRHSADLGERALTRFIALAWFCFIAVISLMPLKVKYRVGTMGMFHNPGHFVAFLVASILLCRAAVNGKQRLVGCAEVCLFAVLMEVLEWAVYHNPLEWRDIFVDLAGAFLGVAVVALWSLRLGRSAQQQIL
jgi:hypothetical protein